MSAPTGADSRSWRAVTVSTTTETRLFTTQKEIEKTCGEGGWASPVMILDAVCTTIRLRGDARSQPLLRRGLSALRHDVAERHARSPQRPCDTARDRVLHR